MDIQLHPSKTSVGKLSAQPIVSGVNGNAADIVDQTYFQHTPGTEILLDEKHGDPEAHSKLRMLQHASDHSDVILVPQPSLNDPNDPLRWPKWKKWVVFANALDFAFNGSITGPIMAAGIDRPD